jgi:hypothetical protein
MSNNINNKILNPKYEINPKKKSPNSRQTPTTNAIYEIKLPHLSTKSGTVVVFASFTVEAKRKP